MSHVIGLALIATLFFLFAWLLPIPGVSLCWAVLGVFFLLCAIAKAVHEHRSENK